MNKNLKFFKGWFIFIVLVCLLATSAGAILSLLLRTILHQTPISQQMELIIARGAGLILNLYLSFLFFRWSIQKYILKQEGRIDKLDDI